MGSLTVKLLGSPQHRRAVLQHTAQGRGANVGWDGMGDMDGGREPDPDRSRGHGGHGRSGFAGRVAVVLSRISTLTCLTFFPSVFFVRSSFHFNMPTTNAPDPALRGRFRTAGPEVAAVSSSTLGTNEGRGSMDQCTQPCWASGEARNRAGTAGRGGGAGRSRGACQCPPSTTTRLDTHKIPSRILTMHIADDDKMDARRGFPGMWDSSVCASVTTLHVCCSSVYWMIFGGARWGLQRIQFSQCQWMGSRWTRPALLGFPPLASCMPGLARIPSDARRPAPTKTGSVSPRVRQIYPRPPPFVHNLWGCCRRPWNSRCRRRRHDRIGQS